MVTYNTGITGVYGSGFMIHGCLGFRVYDLGLHPGSTSFLDIIIEECIH